MKNILLFIILLFIGGTYLHAQNENPYAEFGYEGKVLKTPQERQQYMLTIPNPDESSDVALVGIAPNEGKYYLFDKDNELIDEDTLMNDDLGRFLSVDPLSPDYPELTTYQFASNTPIMAIDLDGLEARTQIRAGLAWGTQGVKTTVAVSIDYDIHFITPSYGAAVTYHSNFWNTGKSGFELRNSVMITGNWGGGGSLSLGTNIWNGYGDLHEFKQRTGYLFMQQGIVSFAYENDGTPFQILKLGDGNDSYRSAAIMLGIGDFSIQTNLFTGERDEKSYIQENNRIGGKFGEGHEKDNNGELLKDKSGNLISKKPPEGRIKRILGKASAKSIGQFGEKYKHPFVVERGTKYRFGGLTLNYQGMSVGIDSDRYVRHAIQNVFAHHIAQPQPMFKTLSNSITPISNTSSLSQSKYTLWSNDGTSGD